jgi:outer membrane protein
MRKLILCALTVALAVPALAEDKPAPAAAPAAPAASVVGAPATGKFPAAVVAVVDVQKILQDSSAAKHVREQLASKRDGYQKEVTADEQKLRDAEKKLAEERPKLAEADFAKKRKEFEDNVRTVQQKVQDRSKILDTAFNTALGKIREQLGQIVANAASSRGVTLVLDKGQVVVVESSFDLTTTVLDELNKKLPKVDVK